MCCLKQLMFWKILQRILSDYWPYLSSAQLYSFLFVKLPCLVTELISHYFTVMSRKVYCSLFFTLAAVNDKEIDDLFGKSATWLPRDIKLWRCRGVLLQLKSKLRCVKELCRTDWPLTESDHMVRFHNDRIKQVMVALSYNLCYAENI